MLKFEFQEDRDFFQDLFESLGGVDKFEDLFDFADPSEKRKAFGSIRNRVYEELVAEYGDVCMLKYHAECNDKAEQVDHLIPLSSNNLNKSIRKIKGVNGKKTPTQSFGSNGKRNFVISCARCNAAKKNNLPSAELINKILGVY